jgi:RNA polymerase sigma-70 factor (ECF subfamily)
VSFRDELEALRPYLLRYASLQLRNRDAAVDAVQEALAAALAAEAGFAGRSNLRTWATGILKHKIVDAIRRANREQPLAGEGDTADFDALFDERGHWHEHPHAWPAPDGALQEKQFLEALQRCLEALPPRQTISPLTITVSMPFAGCLGCSNVAASSISSPPKSTRSAAWPSFRTPRSASPKVFAVRPVIL